MKTLSDIVDALRRLHLLDDAQLAALGRPDPSANPRTLAKQLVQRGWLTAFQVNRLFTGRGTELLLGSYVLLELLGEGGMGAVYRARNWKLGQVVALKLIRRERLTNDAAVKRFEREIRASAQLDHPNVVRAIDADAVGGVHFLVMEYVEGGQDLHRLVKEQGPLPVAEARAYVRQAALGLQQAYERGLVHRDIKPHNLLLANGQVKILDFGLARLGEGSEDSSTLTQEGAVMGTLDYLAPEQARDSHAADIRADLYSLGCTLYFLLTGQAPFPGGAAAQKMYRHQFDEPPPVESLRPAVPPALAMVVRRLMTKRPDERYQTPAALAVDLEAVLSGAPIAAAAARRHDAPAAPATSPTARTSPVADNPFAQLSQGETATNAPATLHTAPATAGASGERGQRGKRGLREKRGLLLAVLAGVALIVPAGILTGLFLSGGTPPDERDGPAVKLPAAGKPPTAREIAAAAQKRKQEDARAKKQRLAEEEQERRRWREAEETLRQRRAADATEPLKRLQAKFSSPAVTFTTFGKEVAAFRAKHGGSPAAIRAAELLMKLPSPLDALDPNTLPQDCSAAWKALGRRPPQELAGVLGEHRRRHWLATAGPIAANRDGTQLAVAIGAASHATDIGLLDPRTGDVLSQFKAHPDVVLSLSYSPTRDVLASASRDRTAKLWDMTYRPPRCVHVFEGFANSVYGAPFRPQGDMLALTSMDGTIQFWDVTGGTPRKIDEFKTTSSAFYATFSPDGKFFACGGGTGALLYEIRSGKPVPRGELGADGIAAAVAFGPDSKWLATSGPENAIRIWDLEGPRPKERERLAGLETRAETLTISPDGRKLVSADFSAATRLWDLATKKSTVLLKEFGGCCFAPSGKQLFTNGPAVRIWDVETGQQVQPLQGPVTVATDVTFHPGAARLAARDDKGTVRLWDMPGGAARQTTLTDPPKSTDPVPGLAVSADGELFTASSRSHQVWVWDLATGTKRQEFLIDNDPKCAVTSVALDPTGGSLAAGTAAGWVRLVDLAAGKVGRKLDAGSPRQRSDILCMSFSPDGRMLATGSRMPDGPLRVWDVETGKPIQDLRGHGGHVLSVAFAPEGRYLVSGGSDRTVRIWDVLTGKEKHKLTGHTGSVHCVAVSPDGRMLASAGDDGEIFVWQAESGVALYRWQFPGPVYGAAFAADGRHLATANGNGTVYVLRLTDAVKPPPALSDSEARQQQVATAERLGVPATIEHALGMRLQLIPPGRFLMGSPASEPGRAANEGPQHPVRITRPFYLGAHEVTVGQFKAFVAATGYRTEAEKSGKGSLCFDAKTNSNVMDATGTWRAPGFAQTDAHPVVCVSWDDAVAFCAWLGKQDGRRYRLPTEAEWEYACRAGAQTAYPFGNGSGELERHAWTGTSGGARTAAVGQLKPNAWGLHDMLGNAWEWCLDGPRSYAAGCTADPRGPTDGTVAVIRGASTHPQDTTPMYRVALRFNPWQRSVPVAYLTFRVLCEADGNAP